MQKIICFHNPDEKNGYLSNWYLSKFSKGNVMFSSMEQYMMYQKAMAFQDTEVARQILDTGDVAKIKALGRAVKNYSDIVWNGIRQPIVYEGLLEKFYQNKDLRERLLETQSAVLVECAVNDRIWGIGLDMRDPKRFDMGRWEGQNLLGFTLMLVRDQMHK